MVAAHVALSTAVLAECGSDVCSAHFVGRLRANRSTAAPPQRLTPAVAAATATAATVPAGDPHYDPTALAVAEISSHKVKPHDWPMWGGWTARNNTPEGKNIPIKWDAEKKTNIKWTAKLGSQTYGNPVVANGKVYVGTNNGAGYIKRYPPSVDLGCLLCFDEKTGKFLWQHSNPKLPQGRVNDWPQQGVCSTPYCDGDRLWYVTNRGEVVCLDANGFYDGKNDGPYTAEPNENKDEADVIWRYDMMAQMGVAQHNMCSCSICCVGDVLFVCTSNGVDFDHLNIPAPNAPSFFAMDRNTAKVLWTDKSPGLNILHGQWSSPTYGVFGGQPQVIFGGGDGWLYSFDPAGDGQGHGKVLWKFDCNPKDAKYSIDGRSTRNHIIATPVIYDGLIYCAVGEDPEHGPGNGHLWCIDPTKRGDVSPDLAVDKDGKPLPERRIQAVNPDGRRKGDPQSEFCRGLALRQEGLQRRQGNPIRRGDAPHDRHRGDQGRPGLHLRLQRALPLSRRQDGRALLGSRPVQRIVGLAGDRRGTRCTSATPTETSPSFRPARTKKVLSEVNVGNAVLYVARRRQRRAVHRQSLDAVCHQRGRQVAVRPLEPELPLTGNSSIERLLGVCTSTFRLTRYFG